MSEPNRQIGMPCRCGGTFIQYTGRIDCNRCGTFTTDAFPAPVVAEIRRAPIDLEAIETHLRAVNVDRGSKDHIRALLAELARLTAEHKGARQGWSNAQRQVERRLGEHFAAAQREYEESNNWSWAGMVVLAIDLEQRWARADLADLASLRTRLRGLEQQWLNEASALPGNAIFDAVEVAKRKCADELARLLTTPEEG